MIGRSIAVLISFYLSSINADRSYCFSGSDLYQLESFDCTAKDSSYTGDWYCSTMTICESYIDSDRDCVTTRGCAQESQCVDPSTSEVYSDHKISTSSNQTYGGIEVTVSCCKAGDFPSDDALAIDMGDICNSASSLYTNVGIVSICVALLVMLSLFQ